MVSNASKALQSTDTFFFENPELVFPIQRRAEGGGTKKNLPEVKRAPLFCVCISWSEISQSHYIFLTGIRRRSSHTLAVSRRVSHVRVAQLAGQPTRRSGKPRLARDAIRERDEPLGLSPLRRRLRTFSTFSAPFP